MNLENFIAIVGIIIALAPIAFKIFILISQKSHSQKLQNLSKRAEIIVSALEQVPDLTGPDKKDAALQKLAIYAKEVGIKVTAQQLDDYIESAVLFIKHLTK